METKTVKVYSEKLGEMVDVEVINKDSYDESIISVMLVVDEEEE